jgi:hypothetical protein
MRRTARTLAGGVVMTLVAVTACDDTEITPTDEIHARSTQDAQQWPEHWWRMYPQDMEQAQQIPGYAGVFFEDDTAVVYVLDPETQGQAARDVMSSYVRESTRSTPSQVDVRKARYTFIELISWREKVDPLISKYEDIHVTAIDVIGNRIEVGITPQGDQSVLTEELDARGIPRDAVGIWVVEFGTTGQSS